MSLRFSATVRSIICCAVLLATAGAAYGQNDNSQGNSDNQGYPAVPSARPGESRPHAWIRGYVGHDAHAARTTVLNPTQIAEAYDINLIANRGQGATVAIVDAYDSPNALSDLAYFSSYFGVTCSSGTPTFKKVNQSGNASPLPSRNSGWEVEINLDTQWVHAVAPCANVTLVEANSNSNSDLMAAVDTARGLASIVSMSWGGREFSGETLLDNNFIEPGVTFLASSGDSGGVVEWPASSPNVLAVGGTNLSLGANGTVLSEGGWSGSGGGCSTYESPIPGGAQVGFVPASCKHRATPDVAMDGGGNSPVYVYISEQGGWYSVYGTSLSVQLWAGVIALANGSPRSGGSLGEALSDLYVDAAGAPTSSEYTGNFRDIVSGSAGRFSCTTGWDYVTGLGTPKVDTLLPAYLDTQN